MQYNIHGDNMPVVICSLDDGESMICEAGAMSAVIKRGKFMLDHV